MKLRNFQQKQSASVIRVQLDYIDFVWGVVLSCVIVSTSATAWKLNNYIAALAINRLLCRSIDAAPVVSYHVSCDLDRSSKKTQKEYRRYEYF